MSKNNLKKAEDRIEELLAARDREIETRTRLAEEAERAMNEAQQRMEKESLAEDMDAYLTAVADREKAFHLRELHKKRIAALTESPAIDAGEYETMCAEITAEVKEAENQSRAKLAQLAEEMYAEGQRFHEIHARANVALRKLQHDLYLDADRRRGKYGDPISQCDMKRIVAGSFYSWAECAIRHFQYEQTTGKKIAPERGRRF